MMGLLWVIMNAKHKVIFGMEISLLNVIHSAKNVKVLHPIVFLVFKQKIEKMHQVVYA
jgi:hypothetical protein